MLDDFELPECQRDFKKREKLEKLDSRELWEKLNKLDSARANLIHPNNNDKIIRSIVMCEFLGMPISEYKRKENNNYDSTWFMPEIEREDLYKKINLRVDKMLDMGLYSEWQKNKELYPNSRIIQNTIGYSEFFEYENKDYAIEKIKQHTRNFAKRQLTYFRAQKNIIKIKNLEDILKNLTC